MNASDAVSSLDSTIAVLENVKQKLDDNDTYDFDIEALVNRSADTADEIEDYIDDQLG